MGMMYWIVFALLSSIEGITDVLFGFWLPFYTEFKILLQIWLILPISPRSLGSGVLYQRFVHRYLVKREGEIDRSILQLKEQGYASVIQGSKNAMHYVMNAICNLMINAPVYAAEFVQKYGYVNSEDTNIRSTTAPKPNFFQDILDNIGSKFASYDKQYDSDRFEEIDGKNIKFKMILKHRSYVKVQKNMTMLQKPRYQLLNSLPNPRDNLNVKYPPKIPILMKALMNGKLKIVIKLLH